jgi:hypothetical protein
MQSLYAAGFNAHAQLIASENKNPPTDVTTFSRIATGKDIRVLFAGWSCTICKYWTSESYCPFYERLYPFVERFYCVEIAMHVHSFFCVVWKCILGFLFGIFMS